MPQNINKKTLNLLASSNVLKALFTLGLLLRFCMLIFLEPTAQDEWFIPFLKSFLENPSIDPWLTSLRVGEIQTFPYGIVMFFAFLPCVLLSSLIFGINELAIGLGIKFTLLFFDILCFYLLFLHFNKDKNALPRLLVLYWLLPAVIVATYWAGQLDIIPVTLLLFSFIALRKDAYRYAGIALVFAISAKMSMAYALPFLAVYFLRSTRMYPFTKQFFIPFFITSFFFLTLPLSLHGYREMVIGTSELSRLFDLTLSISNAKILITPLLLSLILYIAWSMPHLTYHLLTAFLALTTLTLTLTTTTPPGWFVWIVPFLLLHIVPVGIMQRFLCYCFFSVIAVSQIFFWQAPINIDFIPLAKESFLYSSCLTFIIALGLILMYGILRNSFYRNETFRFGRKPISIGIAGDSSVGKDTLATALIHLFGASSTVHISGDDYHSWDRKGPLWRVMTHLNPRANDIDRFYADINKILDKKTIVYRHYQHTSGTFSKPLKMKSKNFCIVSGLHTLLQKTLAKRFDVRIFISMNEDLRAFLKCRRDQKERNHSLQSILDSMQKRKSDAQKFIEPQSKNADIIFTVEPATECNLTDISQSVPPLLLTVTLKRSLYHEELLRYLIASCGMNVSIEIKEAMEGIVLKIEGNIAPDDIEFMVNSKMPQLSEMLAVQPKWHADIQGIMQLIVLYQLIQELEVNR